MDPDYPAANNPTAVIPHVSSQQEQGSARPTISSTSRANRLPLLSPTVANPASTNNGSTKARSRQLPTIPPQSSAFQPPPTLQGSIITGSSSAFRLPIVPVVRSKTPPTNPPPAPSILRGSAAATRLPNIPPASKPASSLQGSSATVRLPDVHEPESPRTNMGFFGSGRSDRLPTIGLAQGKGKEKVISPTPPTPPSGRQRNKKRVPRHVQSSSSESGTDHDEDADDEDDEQEELDEMEIDQGPVPIPNHILAPDMDALYAAVMRGDALTPDQMAAAVSTLAAMREINEAIQKQIPSVVRRNAQLDYEINHAQEPVQAEEERQLTAHAYGNRGHIAARATYGGPSTLNDVTAPDNFVNHRPKPINDRNYVLRSALLLLLGVEHYKHINFNLDERDDLPTSKDYFINWWRPWSDPSNAEAIQILADYLINTKTVDWGHVKPSIVREKIRRHLKVRTNYYLGHMDATLAAIKGLKASALSRAYGVLHRRLTVLLEYITVAGIEPIYRLFHALGIDGTSSDEEDAELSRQKRTNVYVVHDLPKACRLSRDINTAKEIIDSIYQDYHRAKLPKGSLPHSRVRSIRAVPSKRDPSKRVYGLPLNAYDEEWYNGLPVIKQRDLKATAAIDFQPLLVVLESLRTEGRAASDPDTSMSE